MPREGSHLSLIHIYGGRVDRLRRIVGLSVVVGGNRAVVLRGAVHADDGGLHGHGRRTQVVDVRFHCDDVVAGRERGGGDEDLGERGGGRSVVGSLSLIHI